MGTLSSCLKKIGLSEHEAAILRGAADDNIKDGDEAHVAAVRAVSDFIEQLEKERAAIAKQVIKAGGKPTAAPFQFVDLADLTRVLRKPRHGNDGADANRDVTDPAVRWSVAGAVATRFLQGNGFDTITQARAFVAEKLGLGKIEAGTEAAKYADEIIENGVVKAARHIVQKGTLRGAKKDEVYDRLVELYDQQPRLGVRTSTSVREQAYSTPAPLAYVAARLANVKPGTPVYEPTAGNGMLLINSLADSVVANELNDDRFAMLKQSLPGAHLIQGDATKHDMARGTVRAVLANPPFGVVKDSNGQSKVFQTTVGYETREIDHAIVFKALDSLPDDGTATLIVGGVMGNGDEARKDGYRAKAKREFYFNLYGNYKVAQHFTVSGDLYEKQGAGYPVDVIVIAGRGKSERALPAANLPKVYNSWNELKEVLSDETRTVATGNESAVRVDDGADQAGQGDAQSVAGNPGRPGAVDGNGVGRPGNVDAAGGQGNGLADAGTQGGGAVAGDAQSGAANGVQSERPGNLAGRGKEQRTGAGNAERPGKLDSGSGSSNALNDRRGQEVETSRQVTYEPRSASAAVGTLVPINMRDAVQNSLNRLEEEVGDLDEFVASRIGMDVDAMQRNFSAEQVDALAMAINNAEHGGGFIIGDQTGIGKGRIVAGMIRYAINQGLTPVFVTEKPNLYADMMRDLADIGMGDMLGYGTDELRVLMTNKEESVPYGANGEYQMPKLGRQADSVMQEMIANERVDPKYLAVFTTYSQMQTSGGNMPDRMKAIQAIMPNAYLILDESHNAGGTGVAGGRKTAKQLIAERTNGFVGRSGFMRLLVQKAKASFFSSATYAKRPNVMDLYQSTNMIHAVDKPEQLGDAIARGGVPLQQITAAMLAADGQYMRRERSFHGVKYDTKPVAVDKDAAENMAKAMSEVLNFSRAKDGAIAKLQNEYDAAGAMLTDVGNNAKTAVEGANFGSIMHNLIDQMLLALKTKGAVDEALAALARGEKVVLTVANTMGSFIADYAREMELSPGQPVNLSFTDLYRKYLEKQRWVKIKAANGDTSMYRLTDDDLGPVTAAYFRRIDDWIKQANFGDAPISPIDYLHAELRKRKINGKAITTDEITGRTATINYEGVTPVLSSRNSSIKTRLKAINGFNNGDIDVLILNQSGSTGLSLHASEKFKDQRQRHMILIQAEKNIDTHMQMLGRIHRTGQVKLPIYSQLMADIPAELRPAAVLQGKMAKLTANTTASKDSDFAADGVVDFMNDYGGQVAVEYLLDNPEVYHKLGGSDMMTLSQDDASEDDIRKLTGYIPLLPIKMQEQVYADLVARYNELIQRETELGTNKLEARALDLDAETLASEVADPGKPEKHSLFAAPVVMERVSVKRTSKPMTREQVEKAVANRLSGSNAHTVIREMQNQLREKVGEYINKVVAERTERGDEEAKIEAAVDVIRGMLAIANDKLSTYRIGTAHQINLDGQIFYGIVTDVKHHERAANPAAQSAWTVQFALAMADANSVTLPFSQLGEKFKTEQINGTMWGDLASGGNRWVSIPELFDLAQTTGREKRWMVTGNLLSGYAKFPGQLIHYTKQDGSQAQGILMGRAYDYGKTKEMLGARFNKVERILAFFSQALSRSVISDQDNAMRIEQERPGSFIIQVPKSKRAGGHYFLDTQLTDIIGSDFVTVGQNMRANVQGIEKIGDVLRHVLGEQADYFTAMTNKDIANRINDEANQNAGGDARFARPDGKRRDNVMSYDKPAEDITREEESALAALKSALARAEGGGKSAPAWINAIQLQTVPDAHARFAATIEKLFGVKIHFVKAEENGRAVGFNGLYAGGRNLFVNTLASEPYSSIIGHEFLHYLAENKPTLFKAFQKIAEPLMAERAEQYAMARMAEYKAAGHKQMKAFELGQEEVYADTFGDLWSDESFWRELAGRKGAKGIVSRIMDQLRQFIGRILGALDGGKRNETDGFYTDDKAIRNAVLDTTQQAMAKRGKWLADAGDRLAKYMKAQGSANTIDVDGVERPRTNSEGRPIHPSEYGIRNFWRWFSPSPSQLLDGLSIAEVSSLKRDTEALADFIESQSSLPESDRFSVIPPSVFAHVSGVVNNRKILDAVVRSLPVDVVNFLSGKKLSAKEVLHDSAMLENMLSVDPASNVSLGVNPSRIAELAVRVIANAGAKISGLANGALKRNSAVLADTNDPVLGAHVRKSSSGDLGIIAGFGDSKVVDAEGRPLVVYHGTNADFTAFDNGRRGQNYNGHGSFGFYFTDEPGSRPWITGDDSAAMFARQAEEKNGGNQVVMPVYLSAQNPLVVKSTGSAVQFIDMNEDDLRLRAERNGNDGIFVKGKDSSVYVVFNPTQIKSATGNNGSFDPASPNIMFAKDAKSTSVSPSEIRAALIDRFGERGIKALESAGVLKIIRLKDAQDAMRALAEEQGASALYGADGVAYLFSDRMTTEDAPGKLLHEIGEHYGLERMLGADGWGRMKKRIVAMAKAKGSVAYGAWEGVKANYTEFANKSDSELAGNERFLHEVLAALGENKAGMQTSLWREMLAAVKAWLASKGLLVDWINEGDIANLVSGSLKKAMRDAEAGLVAPEKMESLVETYFRQIVSAMKAADQLIEDCA